MVMPVILLAWLSSIEVLSKALIYACCLLALVNDSNFIRVYHLLQQDQAPLS